MLRRALLSTTVDDLLATGRSMDLAHHPALAGLAQEATPELGADFPEGIEVVTLGSGVVDALPAAPAQLGLERLTMEPGDEQSLPPAPGPEVHYVEAGTVPIADELGVVGAYPAGSRLFLPAGVPYAVRNGGPEAGG